MLCKVSIIDLLVMNLKNVKTVFRNCEKLTQLFVKVTLFKVRIF